MNEQITEFGSTELISQGIIDDLAEASRRHGVMISITVTPYTDEAEEE